MTENLTNYLGKSSQALLADAPFRGWQYEKSFEAQLDEPIFQYVFPENGLEMRCDQHDLISAIFITDEALTELDEALSGISLSTPRAEILTRFGPPSKSGKGLNDPILGEYGPWDRFRMGSYAVHFEYNLDATRIEKITLMRSDIVPG